MTYIDATHPASPLGETRYHNVLCRACFAPTMNICALCNRCCDHVTPPSGR